MEELEDTAQEASRWVQVAVQVTVTARMWMTSQRESKHSSWLPPVVPDPTHGMPQRAVCQDSTEFMEFTEAEFMEAEAEHPDQHQYHQVCMRSLRVT